MGALVWRVVKTVVLVLFVAVLAATALAGWTAWRIRSSVPAVEGQQRVAGLDGPVVIARDEHGVPHIFGADDRDVFFGLGYAHAQDRLFQMDMTRRAVEGRLGEIIPAFVGGGAVARSDVRARMLGHPRTVASIAAQLDGPVADAVEAYAAGVNAYLSSKAYRAPPEYVLLAASPAPWTAEDTAAVWLYMTEDLISGSTSEEYQRAVLADRLTPEQISEFLTAYPKDGRVSLAAEDLYAANPGLARLSDGGAAAGVEGAPAPGSNNWVVSGGRTRSGKPLLANDPHLALQAPGVWYLTRLALREGDVVGGTIAGGPFVVLGHNEKIAWGFTNTEYDVADYLLRPKGAPAAATHEEKVRVRFGKPVTVTVREAEEGAILDPAWFNLAPFGDAQVVLRTTADDLDNRSPNFLFALMTAGSWDDVVAAGRDFVAPMQNIVVATVDGDIGYLSPGRMPIRGEGGEWTGDVPYQDLPKVLNPASGAIVTANNKIVPDSYPYPLPGTFAVYRAPRIQDLLAQTAQHDAESFRSIQLDQTSGLAQRLLPSIARARPVTDQGRAAQHMLDGWNGVLGADSAQALVYSAWLEELHAAVYADELGGLFARFEGPRLQFIDRVLSGELSQWCDDVGTPGRETCADAMGKAFDLAAAKLAVRYGGDPSAWRWGAVHEAVFAHPLLTGAPLFDGLFTVRVPVGGDATTVNVGHFAYGEPDFHVIQGASMRAIYDLADLDRSSFMTAPGQSGNPLSPHYRDLAGPWAAGAYIEIDTGWELRNPPPGVRTLELLPE